MEEENPDVVIFQSTYHDVMKKAKLLTYPFRIEPHPYHDNPNIFAIWVPTLFEISALAELGFVHE